MEKKINVAELLKDCPTGMELDCTMYDDLVFVEVDLEAKDYPITTRLTNGTQRWFTSDGRYELTNDAKCVIFPKGKTTWKGFVPPCNFKAGDVLVSENGNIVLLSHINSENIVHYHCIIPTCGSFRIEENTSIGVGKYYECVLANEQQRQRMYDKIKCSGYKYNQSTNTLEKLVKPNFKVGDRIVKKNSVCVPILITNVSDEFYYSNTESSVGVLSISEQDNWVLVLDKFDINTLVPFESKVLVRDCNSHEWEGEIFTRYDNKSFNNCNFVTLGGRRWKQCIPYEGNEHLLGKTDGCDNFYKNWN